MDAKPKLEVFGLFREAREVFARRPFFCAGTWAVFTVFGQGTSLGEYGGSVVMLLILILLASFSGAVRGGYDLTMLRLLRGEDGVVFRDLFQGFAKFWSLLGVQLSMGIAVGLVAAPTFIALMFASELPGIAGQLLGGVLMSLAGFGAATLLIGLSMAFLLVMEDDLVTSDALMDSWSLTGGHRWRIFSIFLVALSLEAVVFGLAGLAFTLVSALIATELPAIALGGILFLFGSLAVGSISQLALMGAYRALRQHRDGEEVGAIA